MEIICLILSILFLLHLPDIQAESHRACKTVGEVSASSENANDQIHRRAQGPPGKRSPQCQKGDKGRIGPKGVKGDTGVVDYDRINATIQESLQLVLARLDRIERRVNCPIWIEENCFIPVIDKLYNLDEAREACSERSSKLADVTSRVTYDFIMSTIRSKYLSGRSVRDLWLGMTITPSTGKVVLSDGSDAPYLKWDVNYPTPSSIRTGMLLRVVSNSSSSDQHFWNSIPSHRCRVLCMILK